MNRVSKLLLTPLSILAGLMVAGVAAAQATAGVVDPTAVVAAITGNTTTVAAIGGGVLLLVVSIFAFKWSRRAL
jgi:hypothetical protein